MNKPQKYLPFITIVSLLLTAYCAFNLYILNKKIIKLGCDIGRGFIAERQYTYPIIRTIDDPSNYAKDFKNPLLTDSEYYQNCIN